MNTFISLMNEHKRRESRSVSVHEQFVNTYISLTETNTDKVLFVFVRYLKLTNEHEHVHFLNKQIRTEVSVHE
ncbi:hypothetical protein HanRHA438_Chr13g0604431 [Helianthus annuus]|nr:hypothetical protein HanRHA438_Chr13g0604431 [Helianthus annuus]